MLLLSLIVFLVVLVSAASNFMSVASPDLAVLLNPLNTEARITKLSGILGQKIDPAEVASLKKSAVEGIGFDPVDARLYSLLGVLNDSQGQKQQAQRLYQHSLKLSRTEIQALIRRFVFNLENRNYVEAVSLADIILRRWHKYWDRIAPGFAFLLKDKAAYQEALLRFSKYPRGQDRIIDSLSNDVASTVIARRLIRDWHKDGPTDLRKVINKLTRKLIGFEQYLPAYRLFALTLTDKEKRQSGYIFNGNFDLEPNGNTFDWRLVRQAGLSSSIVNLPAGGSSRAKAEKALEFRFLDAPIRFSHVLQGLMLPPSKFVLKLTYSTSALKTVKPIILQVECGIDGKPLASLAIESGTRFSQEAKMVFEVPSSGCDYLRLRIYNRKFVESWKNRYSGSLYLQNVAIELDGA